MPSAISESTESGGSAPTYSVPQKRIVSIEHPCIVNNFNNGFKSLGGEHQLKHVLEHEVGDRKGPAPVALASLRPNDPVAKKLTSTAGATQNILVKVTVPKRTGRKRKRGSYEPFTATPSLDKQSDSITAPELLQRLRDNLDTYTMQAVGVIQDTHCFQSLPDFQIRAEEIPIMREIRDHAMSPDYDKLKKFHIDCQPGRDGITAFPGPPSFLPVGQPYEYEYKQASADERPVPKKNKVNPKQRLSMLELGISLDTEEVPQGPPSGREEAPGTVFTRNNVGALKALLDERPIITIRAAAALLEGYTSKSSKGLSYAVQYVGYYINKGPWEGTIVKYGVDPRKDPKYRFYQTLQFHFEQVGKMNAELKRQGQTGQVHIFDGKTLVEVAKYWQLCDLTDPVIQELVNTDEIRAECDDKKFGWYWNGTMAKIRVIVREKMIAVVNSEAKLGEDEFRTLTALPDQIKSDPDCQFDTLQTLYMQQLARDIAKDALKGPFKSDRILRQPMNGVNVEEQTAATESHAEDEDDEDDEALEDLDLAQGNEEASEEGQDEDDSINGDPIEE